MKELLNECVAVLNGEVATGQSNVYVTIDRGRYNNLLQAIAEMKRELIRQETKIHTRDFRKKDRRQDDITKKTLREIYSPICSMCQDKPAVHSGVCNTCSLDWG